MWGLARFAALLPRTALANPARVLSENSTSAHGPAQITAPKSKPNGAHILTRETLYRRGLMLHNRNPEAAERYASRNLILAKGVCCE